MHPPAIKKSTLLQNKIVGLQLSLWGHAQFKVKGQKEGLLTWPWSGPPLSMPMICSESVESPVALVFLVFFPFSSFLSFLFLTSLFLFSLLFPSLFLRYIRRIHME